MADVFIIVWDCSFCGATHIQGNLEKCPRCGHPQNKKAEFYIGNPRHYIFDENAVDKYRQDLYWTCQICGCQNEATSTACQECEVDRDSKTKLRKSRKRLSGTALVITTLAGYFAIITVIGLLAVWYASL